MQVSLRMGQDHFCVLNLQINSGQLRADAQTIVTEVTVILIAKQEGSGFLLSLVDLTNTLL